MIGCVLVLFNARPAAAYLLSWCAMQSCYKVNKVRFTIDYISIVQSAKDEFCLFHYSAFY